jgi:acyl carrier protein
MTREAIVELMHPIFLDVFELETISLTEATSALDIEQWDSLTHFQLVVALEKQFHILFNASEIQNWKNVGNIVDGIQAKL